MINKFALAKLRKNAIVLIESIDRMIDELGAMSESMTPKELSALADLDNRNAALKNKIGKLPTGDNEQCNRSFGENLSRYLIARSVFKTAYDEAKKRSVN